MEGLVDPLSCHGDDGGKVDDDADDGDDEASRTVDPKLQPGNDDFSHLVRFSLRAQKSESLIS